LINQAVMELLGEWEGPDLQVVHLTGERFYAELSELDAPSGVKWVRLGFEPAMEVFYSVTDLVIARAGGAVAELTATGTPAILVPGDFGSGGHQVGNARFVTGAGAAVTIPEAMMSASLADTVRSTLLSPDTLSTMRLRAKRIAKPNAAHTIADVLIGAEL
jgi:UDP-N-acetylglucosamine--N-acetylmuramyl-(pentapeptide) pyrophosphoryl-undecaprenol N-acetylglucosamine transferase